MELYISAGALLLSIIFGVISFISSRKSNKLQTEVLSLSKQINSFEIRKGEVLLLGLIGKYFTIQLNCWELDGKMKTDKLSIKLYINELKQLNSEGISLFTNPFYIEMLKKHPEIHLLWISLRYSITEREESKTMAVNSDTFRLFYNLYHSIKNEINDKSILENEFYWATNEATEFLKTEIYKLT